MEVCYLQELSYWTAQSLSVRLDVDIEFANELIRVLAARGILKLKSNDEIDEYDLLGSDTVDVRGKYQLVFVGLAIYKDVVLVVYPKYFGDSAPTIGQMRVVFKVIMRCIGRQAPGHGRDRRRNEQQRPPRSDSGHPRYVQRVWRVRKP